MTDGPVLVRGDVHEGLSDADVQGIEFLSFEAFQQYIDQHSGLNMPEVFEGPNSLVPA